jgi:hypothetical protein
VFRWQERGGRRGIRLEPTAEFTKRMQEAAAERERADAERVKHENQIAAAAIRAAETRKAVTAIETESAELIGRIEYRSQLARF